MHESDRSRMRNGGYDLRRVDTPPVTHASNCINCQGVQLIYNACFGDRVEYLLGGLLQLRCILPIVLSSLSSGVGGDGETRRQGK
jgi:hypothetical protein